MTKKSPYEIVMEEVEKLTEKVEDKMDSVGKDIKGDIKDLRKETHDDLKDTNNRIDSMGRKVAELEGSVTAQLNSGTEQMKRLQENQDILFDRQNTTDRCVVLVTSQLKEHKKDPNLHTGEILSPDALKAQVKAKAKAAAAKKVGWIGGGTVGTASILGLIYWIVTEILPNVHF